MYDSHQHDHEIDVLQSHSTFFVTNQTLTVCAAGAILLHIVTFNTINTRRLTLDFDWSLAAAIGFEVSLKSSAIVVLLWNKSLHDEFVDSE